MRLCLCNSKPACRLLYIIDGRAEFLIDFFFIVFTPPPQEISMLVPERTLDQSMVEFVYANGIEIFLDIKQNAKFKKIRIQWTSEESLGRSLTV